MIPLKNPSSHAEASPPRSVLVAVATMMAVALVLGVLVVSYWATLSRMAERWSTEPQYSHGFLVPVFALALVCFNRRSLRNLDWRPAWTGLLVLLAGVGLRIFAINSDIEPLDAFSIIPATFGVVLLVGGWRALRATWGAIAFLAFMLPLPFFVETSLALPLRHIATILSTLTLQACGCPALAEGNVIYIENIRLGVEDACSGLGMLMTFFALSTAYAAIVRGGIWERFLLVASAIPIAIIANVLRITGTGLAYYYLGIDSPLGPMIYHDLAGWLMMPFALFMLWLELRLVSYVLVEETEPEQVPIVKPSRAEFVPVR